MCFNINKEYIICFFRNTIKSLSIQSKLPFPSKAYNTYFFSIVRNVSVSFPFSDDPVTVNAYVTFKNATVFEFPYGTSFEVNPIPLAKDYLLGEREQVILLGYDQKDGRRCFYKLLFNQKNCF